MKKKYFLKIATKESLQKEYLLTNYFYEKGLGQKILDYISEANHDFLLTEKVKFLIQRAIWTIQKN